VHQRRLDDVELTFRALRSEWVRHHFWEEPFDERALKHARRLGRPRLLENAARRVRSSVGPETPFRDGAQTPFDGNAIYYAQHAVAACCRKCVEYWHGIPRGRPLEADELEYLIALVSTYLVQRLPDLAELGEKVTPSRSIGA